MPDTSERRVAVVAPRGTPGGVGRAFFGIPFVAIGIALLESVLKYVRSRPPDAPVRSQLALPIVFCLFFIGAGISVSLSGLWRMILRRRHARLAAAHPGEPWYADYSWDPKGERERAGSSIAGSLFLLLALCVATYPFNAWAFGMHGPALLAVLIGAVDLLLLGGIALVALRIGRKIRYGRAFIRYDRFPFFLEDRVDVRVGSGKTLPPGVPVTATLRYLVERLGTVGTNPNTTFHQLYADERVFDSASMSGSGGMAVQFPLPSGDYATAISSLYRRFWQLHLHADTPGLDFDEAFVLPVYPRP